MSKSTTNIADLVAAAHAVFDEKAAAASKKAKKAKKADRAPKKVRKARKHCYEARQRRFEETKLGGLTSTQRKTIAALLREQGKDVSDRRTWNAAVKAWKENGFV